MFSATETYREKKSFLFKTQMRLPHIYQTMYFLLPFSESNNPV